MSLPRGAVGWSVIVEIPGNTHMPFFIFVITKVLPMYNSVLFSRSNAENMREKEVLTTKPTKSVFRKTQISLGIWIFAVCFMRS